MKILWIAFFLFSIQALAAEIQTYVPRYRSAEELSVALEKLVVPGVSVVSFGEKLVIRANGKEQIAEVRKVLKELDQPVRQWRVEVRGDATLQSEGSEFGLAGVRENRAQRMQSQSGGVVVRSGGSVSLLSSGAVWRITPRGSKKSIKLKIDQISNESSASVATEVDVRPGRWVEVGGFLENSTETHGKILHRGSGQKKAGSKIQIRLVELSQEKL